jgi:hypothetical protein
MQGLVCFRECAQERKLGSLCEQAEQIEKAVDEKLRAKLDGRVGSFLGDAALGNPKSDKLFISRDFIVGQAGLHLLFLVAG